MRLMMSFVVFVLFLNNTISQSGSWFAGANLSYQNSWILNQTDSDEGGLLDYDVTFHPAFGLDLGYHFNPHFAIQSGIIYSIQGQNYKTANIEDANYKTHLTYLKIPLLLNYLSKPESRYSLVLQGGFQFSLLNQAESSREDVFGFYDAALVDVKSYYENSSIDLVIGLGAQYRFSMQALRLMIRADFGLTDIEVTEKKPGFRNVSTNATLGLPMLSYLIKI